MTATTHAVSARTRTARAGRPGVGTVIAVALLPLAVLALLLAALWQPQERLDTVPAAIVNLDEPVEVDGQTVPLGRQLAAGLVGGGESGDSGGDSGSAEGEQTNYAWEITDAEQATAGLEDGTYAAVVTIPEDFSAAATSYSGDADEARQATIDVATPEGGRVLDDALAQVVATTATDVLSRTLTETYVENLLVGFTTLNEQLGEAANGASELAAGAGEAASGAGALASGAGELADGAAGAQQGAAGLAGGAHQVADGADALASGVGELYDGADALAGGAGEVASGAGELAGGAEQVAGGVASSAAGAHELADGMNEWAAGVQQLSGGASELAGGLEQLNGQTAALPEGISRLGSGYTEISAGLQQYVEGVRVAAGCAADGSSESAECQAVEEQVEPLFDIQAGAQEAAGRVDDAVTSDLAALQAGVSELAGGADELAAGVDQAAAGAQQLAGGADELATGLDQLSGGASQVATGADGLAGGAQELATGASDLASGVGELEQGADQLATGTAGIATGADSLASGVGQLATGTEELATGTDGLASGVGQIADGTGELADGLDQAAAQVPSYDQDERQNLASVAAEPVAAPGGEGIDSGASGPLFAVLALWLGALVLFVVFPATPVRAFGSTRGTVRLTLSALAVPAAIGAVTGTVAGVVLAAVEDLGAGGWVGLALAGALVSLAFVAVNQALVAALGHAGSGLSILVGILVLATGVVSTAPDSLMAARDVLPVGPAIDALAALVFPGVGGLGGAIAILVLWALAGLGVAALAVRRRRTVRVQQLLAA